jgi:uncharacterized membrane-anchored protein
LEPKEVEFWENVERGFEKLEGDFKLSHGGLNKLLAEDRGLFQSSYSFTVYVFTGV